MVMAEQEEKEICRTNNVNPCSEVEVRVVAKEDRLMAP